MAKFFLLIAFLSVSVFLQTVTGSCAQKKQSACEANDNCVFLNRCKNQKKGTAGCQVKEAPSCARYNGCRKNCNKFTTCVFDSATKLCRKSGCPNSCKNPVFRIATSSENCVSFLNGGFEITCNNSVTLESIYNNKNNNVILREPKEPRCPSPAAQRFKRDPRQP